MTTEPPDRGPGHPAAGPDRRAGGEGLRPAGTRPGRRALFSDPGPTTGGPGSVSGTGGHAAGEQPGSDQEIPAGRRAFFSAPDGPTGADRPATGSAPDGGPVARRGPVVVCRTCLTRTPVSVIGLGRTLLPSLWLPARPWPHLARCPACRRVGWCRLEWGRPESA